MIEIMTVNVRISINGGKQKVVHMNRSKAYHPPTGYVFPSKQWELDHQLIARIRKPVTSWKQIAR